VGTLGVAFGGIAAGVFGVPGTLEPGAVIVVGSTLGMALEGVLTAAVFRLMMAGGSTDTGASRAMLELKLLENTVLDDICVEDCVVDGVGGVSKIQGLIITIVKFKLNM
jgi:hypothetical protein